MKRKICVVVTARPSYSRIRSALKAIQNHPDLELQLVLAASSLLDRYGNLTKIVEKDGFKVHAKVFMVVEGDNVLTMAKTTGMGAIELATIFDNLKPDAVVTIADRFETMATAIAASYMNIPLVHVQGGEVTGSIDEKVRHAITKLADLHLVSTKLSRERVIRMGEEASAVHITGCPSIDIASEVLNTQKLDFDPLEKYGGVGESFPLSQNYIVVMQHPVTTEFSESKFHVMETLHAVHESGVPALWFWPNVDAGSDGTSRGIRAYRENQKPKNIHFFKNMEPVDFLKLLFHSRGIVGNSSVAIRECSYLGVPAVNIGSRQAGRERGHNVVDVGYDRKEIFTALMANYKKGRISSDPLFGTGDAGQQIANTLAKAELRIDKKLTY